MFSSTYYKGLLKTGTVTLLSLAGLFGAAPAFATVLNGGFESGNFNGWKTVGTTSVETAKYKSGPTEGTHQAMLSTLCPALEQNGCSENDEQLLDFLSLEADELNALDNGELFEGTALKTTLQVEAGDVLSFDWNFLTLDRESEDYNDYAFMMIAGETNHVSELSDTFSTINESSTAFEYETGFHSFEYTFTTAGTYTLAIGVVDVGDGSGDSGLLVDNISISSRPTPTPVPNSASVLGVLAFGAFGVGSRLLRQFGPLFP